jgi:5'-3' exonuclease
MRLLLVDGNYYLYRSFFAIRGLTGPDGQPTNAIFGFAKALRKMLADTSPTHAAVIWDRGLPARRTSLQPAYKQNRPPMPDEMTSQKVWLQDNVRLFGPASISAPDTEADDLIASYAVAARDADVIIATNDKDILQLASDSVRIYSTAKADAGDAGFALLGPAEVTAKWGVRPDQIGDVLALTGDASDNIPGVEGVGSKTASKLIATFGSVTALLERLDDVEPPKLRARIGAAREAILANKSMVALDADLPLPIPPDELPVHPVLPELANALRAFGFKSLLEGITPPPSQMQLL